MPELYKHGPKASRHSSWEHTEQMTQLLLTIIRRESKLNIPELDGLLMGCAVDQPITDMTALGSGIGHRELIEKKR